MIKIVWKYTVNRGQREAFVHEYGPDGAWASLFAGNPGFLETELIQDSDQDLEFLTLDTWDSRESYEAFLRNHSREYGEVDERCAKMTESETKIGIFAVPLLPTGKEGGKKGHGSASCRSVFIYVFDTMADWEPAYLLPELNTGRFFRPGAPKIRIVSVGLDRRPIRTMGGLKLLPDVSLAEAPADAMAAFILPGGDTWSDPVHEPVFGRVRECLGKGILVGALCGATLALASRGFLDSRRHTSNDLGFLKQTCPSYAGEAAYVNEPCVLGDHLVTASGLAPREFARVMFEQLDVLLPATREAWYQLHTTRNPGFFHALVSSLQKEMNP
jgi:putative intracellular protease/amidase/quinol monooxygenase YgiN